MSDIIFFLLVFLAILAAAFRADFLLTLLYLFAGLFLLSRWWSRRALSHVTARRSLGQRAFLGERVPVSLEIHNRGWLPVAWLSFYDSVPPELSLGNPLKQVVSLGPQGRLKVRYELEGLKRGYYPVGPLLLRSGDLFGMGDILSTSLPPDYLTIYPKIIPLTKVKLPASAPLGTLRHTQPVFEDPSRVLGKREYVAGDSLRRVDWKATASSGRLQVKLFEPSIALETAIFLNLNTPEYEARWRFSGPELAIVVAASLANWITAQRQSVGLFTNGLDPLQAEAWDQGFNCPQAVLPRRGRAHLMRLLEELARLQAAETYPLAGLLRRSLVHLSWGATLIVLTANLDDELFDSLFQARRAGLQAVLIPCGPVAGFEAVRQRARRFGFPLFQVFEERDLDIWRQ